MTRRTQFPEWQLALAQELVDSAKRVHQLRQGLAVLIPVLTGASISTTAQMLGLRKSSVCLLRRKLRESGRAVLAERERRGGRRRELMSDAQELDFVHSLRALAAKQGGLRMSVVHAAFEKRVGKRVPRSTVYRLLVRRGWRAAPTRPCTWQASLSGDPNSLSPNLNALPRAS